MPSISKAWVTEARTLAGISASVTIAMLARLAISAVEILAVAKLCKIDAASLISHALE